MPQAIITTVHNWAKRSAREEHLGKMVFFNRNKEKYDWDNEDLSDVVDLSEDNPTLHNDIPVELAGVDLETDSSDTHVVSPAVLQSDAECVQTAIQNSVLIDGSAMGSIGVPTLVDEQPAVSYDPTALSQECTNPKIKHT